jgi:pimeloyl-ACP methyl ester carboxylesterase
MDFESQLNDITASIAVDFNEEKHVLLIAFGGLARKLGFPMFEFNKITSDLDNANKIYLRDQKGIWFHRGLHGAGYNIDGIADYLLQYTTHKSTKKVIIFGNSGGAYTALLMGHILQANEVHAFAPVTFINPTKRLFQRQTPLSIHIRRLLLLFIYGQRKYFDLKRLFKKNRNNRGKYHIYFPSGNKFDNLHATRMKDIPNIYLHPYQYNQHNLINNLKKSGELREIIERSLLIEN